MGTFTRSLGSGFPLESLLAPLHRDPPAPRCEAVMEGCDGHWGTWGADLLLSDQVSLLSSFLLTTAAQPGKHPAHCCRLRNGGAGGWSKAVLGNTVSAREGEPGASAITTPLCDPR